MRSRPRKLLAMAFAIVGLVVVLAPDAFAIIGMPLTPFSVAGVARRSVRRSYYYGYGPGSYYY
jgi:hypothetical protein